VTACCDPVGEEKSSSLPRPLGSLVLAELFVPRPGQYEVFWMGVGSCSLI
jgi:hypothetical protein